MYLLFKYFHFQFDFLCIIDVYYLIFIMIYNFCKYEFFVCFDDNSLKLNIENEIIL